MTNLDDYTNTRPDSPEEVIAHLIDHIEHNTASFGFEYSDYDITYVDTPAERDDPEDVLDYVFVEFEDQWYRGFDNGDETFSWVTSAPPDDSGPYITLVPEAGFTVNIAILTLYENLRILTVSGLGKDSGAWGVGDIPLILPEGHLPSTLLDWPIIGLAYNNAGDTKESIYGTIEPSGDIRPNRGGPPNPVAGSTLYFQCVWLVGHPHEY